MLAIYSLTESFLRWIAEVEKQAKEQRKARKGAREIGATPARLRFKGRGLKRHLDDGGNEIESLLAL